MHSGDGVRDNWPVAFDAGTLCEEAEQPEAGQGSYGEMGKRRINVLTLWQIGVLLAGKENVVLNADLKTIQPVFCAMVDIDGSKVARIINAIEAGQELPPVVVVDLGGTFMPLDGHHRLQAHANLGLAVRAWVIEEDVFEELDIYCRDNDLGRAEDNILCGDRHVFEVAA